MLLNREETKEAISYCFAKVYVNTTQRRDETEAVRVYVASLLSFILHYGETSFLLSKIDDITALLRIFYTDSCSEIVVSTLCGTQYLIDRLASSIHMVAETVIHLLEPLLSHRQRAIRLSALKIVRSLIELDGDRNGIVMEAICPSLLRLLHDPSKEIRNITLLLLDHCFGRELYADCRMAILQALADFQDGESDEENNALVRKIMSTGV